MAAVGAASGPRCLRLAVLLLALWTSITLWLRGQGLPDALGHQQARNCIAGLVGRYAAEGQDAFDGVGSVGVPTLLPRLGLVLDEAGCKVDLPQCSNA